MTHFFTSDLHFGHANIIEYCDRPFDSVEDMNEQLIANWNSVVSTTDTVTVVGDSVMGKKAETLPLIARLNGIKQLCPGNHDGCHPMHKKYEKEQVRYLDAGFDAIMQVAFTYHGFRVCHFPYEKDDRHGDRLAEWNPVDHGEWLIHGHIHGKDRISGVRQIDVGVDAWDYHPVSFEQICDLSIGKL